MQRPIITIPAGFLHFLDVDWDIDWRGQPPGNDTGGGTSVVYNRFPRWIGSPSIVLQGEAIAQWRAIRAQAQGRVGIYRLPMVDPIGFTSGAAPSGTSFAGGASFASGVGFASEPACFAVTDVSAGAVQIRVENAEVAPVVGQIMSHKLWPFLVTWVSEVSAGVYDLGIQMPLADLSELLTARAFKWEAEAGTNNTKLMTPLRTKEAIDSAVAPLMGFEPAYESPLVGFIANTPHTVNHGLGRAPKAWKVVARIHTAGGGYLVGDEIDLTTQVDGDGARGYVSWVNATTMNHTSDTGHLQNTSGDLIGMNTSYNLVFYAW